MFQVVIDLYSGTGTCGVRKGDVMDRVYSQRIFIVAFSVLAVLLVLCFVTPQEANAATTLKGKTVLVEGDSIQAEYGTFLTTACKSLNAKKVDNRAVCGATLALRKSRNSVYTRIMEMPDSSIAKYDYIFIAAGTNDFGNYKLHGR